MNYKEYLIKYSAQKKIDKLAKKYKNRKIAIYGDDEFSQILIKDYDLSKLKPLIFINKDNQNMLSELNCDLILIANHDFKKTLTYLDDHVLYRTKNEGIEVRPIIRLNFFDLLLKGK